MGKAKYGDARLLPVFWRSVSQNNETGCWIWNGPLNHGGYGKTWWKGKHLSSHRKAWIALVGSIPSGLTIDHLCKVRRCCNPEHLELVTQGVNTLRGDGPSAVNARRTHCKRGHALFGDNLFFQKGGKERQCMTCHRERGTRNARARRLRQRLSIATNKDTP